VSLKEEKKKEKKESDAACSWRAHPVLMSSEIHFAAAALARLAAAG